MTRVDEGLGRLALLCRLLRDLGLSIGTGRLVGLTQALSQLDTDDPTDFRSACRALLVSRQDQLALFDAAFDLVFGPGQAGGTENPANSRRLPLDSAAATAWAAALGLKETGRKEVFEQVEQSAGYSPEEVLRYKSFEQMTAEELSQARRLLSAQPWPLLTRRGRRQRPHHRGLVDLRHSLHRSLRSGGEIFKLEYRQVQSRQRPLTMIIDVSGSMEALNRQLLFFAHTLAHKGDLECFVFGTRLTRVTQYLRTRDADLAVQRVSAHAKDIGGGTRIGDAIHSFNRHWARRVLGHGAVTLLVSDGWDRGDPQLLGREMAHLQRSCHRLVWINPLLGDPGYQPLTRGLQAALPHVDDFLPAHNVASLQRLGEHLASLPAEPGWRRAEQSASLELSDA